AGLGEQGGVADATPVAQTGRLPCRRLATCGRANGLPTANRRHGRLPVCATRAGLRPPLADRGQNVGYDFGLWFRSNVSLAMEPDTDRAGFHVAAADDQHR